MLQYPGHVIFRQLFVVSGTKSISKSDSVVPEKSTSAKSEENKLELDDIPLATGERNARLELYFLSKVKSVMEKDLPGLVPETKLADIDIDSIAAAELSSIVKSDFNTKISIADVLQRFSINDIVSLILTNADSSAEAPSQPDEEKSNKWTEGVL
jgi:acyl carrier protein